MSLEARRDTTTAPARHEVAHRQVELVPRAMPAVLGYAPTATDNRRETRHDVQGVRRRRHMSSCHCRYPLIVAPHDPLSTEKPTLPSWRLAGRISVLARCVALPAATPPRPDPSRRRCAVVLGAQSVREHRHAPLRPAPSQPRASAAHS
ncbi:hypothetical protein GGF50DRAFT_117651 [Schizophyllum commune]